MGRTVTMQTSDPLKNRSARSPDLRRAGLALVLTSLATGILAGCDSNGGNALDEFLGTWSTDEAHSAFGPLTCNLPNGSIGPVMFSLWGNLMTLEPGTLVDLVEITGTCPFDFNVKGKVATVPVPDPYADKAPCRIDISGSIAPGTEFLEFQPTIWKFDLLQPQKGVAF